MYYKEYGNPDGQLVVFIHGGFTTNESFEQQYHLLPDKRMIFVDLPGCGKCERVGDKAFSFEDSGHNYFTDFLDKVNPIVARSVPTGNKRGKGYFDVTIRKCLWHTTCSENGCAELCHIFCDADHATYGDFLRNLAGC